MKTEIVESNGKYRVIDPVSRRPIQLPTGFADKGGVPTLSEAKAIARKLEMPVVSPAEFMTASFRGGKAP